MPPQTSSSEQHGTKTQPVEMIWREEVPDALLVPKTFAGKTTAKSSIRIKAKGIKLTMANIAKHNTRDDLWIVVDGKCYDVTAFVDKHPGGWLVMTNMGGKDCTDAFANYHPAKVYEKYLPNFLLGDVVDYSEPDFAKGHRAIRQRLLKEGRFKTDLTYYYKHAAWIASIFAGALYCSLVCESTAMHFVGATLLALFWQQMAFIGHDVGHNSLTHDFEFDNNFGVLIGNLLTGIGIGWWKRSHNVHHIVCNSIENDPDIQHIPVMAVSNSIIGKKFYSSFHEHTVDGTNAVSRFLVGYQHLLFYPIMSFARFNLYVQGWLHVLLQPQVRNRRGEVVTLLLFACWLSALVTNIPNAGFYEKLGYVLFSHALAGVLHVQICLSHFHMDTYHGHAYNDASDEWFVMQLKTTLNITCPEWLDWFHGGLQFQIEHHLWPRLPRHELRYASKLVQEFCLENGVRYHAPTWIKAQVELYESMKKVALEARSMKSGEVDFSKSSLYEGLNAQG